jgi:hypothetical protein
MRAELTVERLLAKTDRSGECWLWTAGKQTHGYGTVWHKGRKCLAHRVAYELLVGPVPGGLELDHLCRVPACVNPDHLEPVTHAENGRRGNAGHINRSKTHCPQGHAYDAANTYVRRSGGRHCRECRRRQNREQKRRMRAV